jgi:hypothetical protein
MTAFGCCGEQIYSRDLLVEQQDRFEPQLVHGELCPAFGKESPIRLSYHDQSHYNSVVRMTTDDAEPSDAGVAQLHI